MKRLSKNFLVSEIFGKRTWDKLPKRTQYLAKQLVRYVLQPIRDKKPGVKIKISSGARDDKDVARIKKQGYNPSVTTDHFFGEPQKIPATTPKNKAKIKLYGPIYTFSVGAVDTVPDIPQTKKAFTEYFEWLVELNEDGEIDAGQIILEKGKYTYWIHISLNARFVYNDYFAKEMNIQRTTYMKSLNNGKTYSVYKPKS